MTQQRSLNLVQLLRGIASLLVIFMHTTINVNENFSIPFLGDFFKFGGAGVDIFFVLSGFIITYASRKALAQGVAGMSSFLKRRFVRIFPTYWILISGFLLVQLLLPAFYKTHYPISITNLLKTFLLLPDHIMVNGVSWTLSYELFFYFLFSLAFIIKSRSILFAAGITYIIVLIALPILCADIEHTKSWIKLVSFPMNVEFFIGVAVALIIPRLNNKISMPFIIIGGLLFLAAGIFSNTGYTVLNNTFNRVMLYGIPSFFIITGIVKYELDKPISMHSILISLGEASYSLYLIHLPIIVAAIKLLAKLPLTNTVLIHGIVLTVILLICAISVLFFKWIEKPLIAKLNKSF